MSANTTCLQHVIGLSQTSCNCYDSGKPVDFNTSDSGIYLDEIEGFPIDTVKFVGDCATGDLWDLMTQARTEAILQSRVDLLNYIGTLTKRKRHPFKGLIGSDKKTALRSL